MRYSYFFIIFLILFFISCTTTKVPIWVKEFGTKTFSKDGLEGIGFAKFNKKDKSTLKTAREQAYNEAIKNLAIKLKTEVRGEIEYKMQDKITYIDKKYKQQASDEVDSLTNVMFETILGRKYFEEYIDYKNSLYWVYVWTTKAELQRAILEELEKQEAKNTAIMKSCIQQLQNAENFINTGNIEDAVEVLNQVLLQISEVKGIYIVDKKDNISLELEAKEKLNSLLNSIELSPVSSTNLEVLRDTPLQLELAVEVKAFYKGKVIKANLFPLKASFLKGAGEIEQLKYTDISGLAKFRVYRLKEKENVIEISPSTNKTNIENKKVVFYILAKSLRESKKIFVKVNTQYKENCEFLKSELVAYLKKLELDIVESNYDYVLNVDLQINYIGDKITLPDGTKQKFAEIYTGSASVELKDLLNNKIILSKSFSGINGFGITKKDAQQNLLKKLAETISNYIDENL